MARPRKQPEGSTAPKTPGWIVSFTDMITLLLAFFVMLQAMAVDQNPELFFQGQGAFQSAVAGFGLPTWLFGEEKKLQGLERKKRYSSPEDPQQDNSQRVLDVEDEKIRQIFRELKRQMDTKTSHDQYEILNAIFTPIHFDPGSHSLSSQDQDYIRDLAVNFAQNLSGRKLEIYIIGSADDMPMGREQWIESAQRAKVVAEVFRKEMGGNWPVFAWGDAGEPLKKDGKLGRSMRGNIRIVVIGVK